MKLHRQSRELISSHYSLMATDANGEWKFIDTNGVTWDEPALLYSSRRHLVETCKEAIEKYNATVVTVDRILEIKEIDVRI